MKTQNRKAWENKLDRLVGKYVRSVGICQAYGLQASRDPDDIICSGRLEWCHIKSRRSLNVRWSLNNSVCLCSRHHAYYTNISPEGFKAFLIERFPEKLKALDEEFREVKNVKMHDLQMLYYKLSEQLANE